MSGSDASARSVDLNRVTAAYARAAVEYSRSTLGVNLDYSVQSVESVEQILSDLYLKLPRSYFARILLRAFTGKKLETACKTFGSYIGEVLRRKRGGTWEVDPRFGNQLCLRKDGSCICPAAKVHKRLTNGPDDSVWLYMQFLMHEKWGNEG